MTAIAIPRPQGAVVGQGGLATVEWYSFFLALRDAAGGDSDLQAQIDALAAKVAALDPSGGSVAFSVFGVGSVVVEGTPAAGIVRLMLDGDSDAPAATAYYGTGPDGVRGWHLVADAIGVTADLTRVIDGTTNAVTLGLADLPNSGAAGTALLKILRDAKGRVAGAASATTNDLAEGSSNLYFTNARADARIAAQKGQANGLATLGADSKIPSAQLPALAITETFVVASQAAQLSLTAQEGDVAVRTDISKNYIHNAGSTGTMSDWTELLTPAAPVQSINGKTGSVTLVTDDIAESGTPTNQWFTAARVRAVVLTGLSTATNAAIAATDSVLSAFGKLQAQITARALDTDVVKLAGTQTVTGGKTFSAGNVIVTGSSTNSTYFALRNTATGGRGWSFYSSGGGPSPAGTFGIYDEGVSAPRLLIGLSGQVQPGQNNVQSLGDPSLLWTQVYATNTTISSSDARLKTEPRDMSAAEIAAFSAIARLPNVWRWIERVESEGDAARLHAGPTVQAAIAVMQSHGLDWTEYSAICYDRWDASPAYVDLDGNEVIPARAAGDRYSFRREELLALIVRAQAAQFDAIEARVAALEVR